jgi:hypothetical protein
VVCQHYGVERKYTTMLIQLFHMDGGRKYVTHAECYAFSVVTACLPEDVHTLCAVLAWTGCRVSEASALTRSAYSLGETVVSDIPLEPTLLDEQRSDCRQGRLE